VFIIVLILVGCCCCVDRVDAAAAVGIGAVANHEGV
jgi:hypothetical protein